MKKQVVVSWSSGKDSAWMLHLLRLDPDVEVRGLITTFNEAADRVAMHAVRRELVEAQARAAGLPLSSVGLPWPCPNGEYERRTSEQWRRCRAEGITHVAFGDLFLEDIRAYREQFLMRLGLSALFPLWGRSTSRLAADAIASGMRAVLCSCDAERLGARFVGRMFDQELLKDLPAGCDPCGENGEFHTFVFDGPGFSRPIPWQRGEVCRRGSVDFCDLLPVQHR